MNDLHGIFIVHVNNLTDVINTLDKTREIISQERTLTEAGLAFHEGPQVESVERAVSLGVCVRLR